MYNPDQPRDADGKWTKTKNASSASWDFIGEHGDELAIGLGIAGAVGIGYGSFVAAGTGMAVKGLAPEAAKIITRAATVRKVGPVSLTGIGKVIPPLKGAGLKTGEAWQYSKGFLSPNLADDALEHIPGGVRQLRLGAEVVSKSGTKTIGAAKPLNYDKIVFTKNKHAVKVGGALVGAGGIAATGQKLHKRNR